MASDGLSEAIVDVDILVNVSDHSFGFAGFVSLKVSRIEAVASALGLLTLTEL